MFEEEEEQREKMLEGEEEEEDEVVKAGDGVYMEKGKADCLKGGRERGRWGGGVPVWCEEVGLQEVTSGQGMAAEEEGAEL